MRAAPPARRTPWILVTVAIVACGGTQDSAPPATADVPADEGADMPQADMPARAIGIAPDGIGAARAGMTVAEIRAALEPDLRLGALDDRFMVDLIGLPVLRGTDSMYYLVFPADETPADASVPLLAVTDHAAVRTAEGIGPGSTLAEAAARYGSPTLRYSADDEMREYAVFPGYSYPGVTFRVAPGDTVFLAGRYEREADYGETGEFDPGARIMMVFVQLRRF